MIKEIIELFELLFTLPIAYLMDFCDKMQRRAYARLSEEEKERRRKAEEKQREEARKRKEEEEEELRRKMTVLDSHLPYSYYQKKKWWE